ncbi:MAG TPA: transglycosylase SLT domain-containing protein [Taishania sp.]|nr:transglycosylase SLT domain-containing protein [Taishania sp.]
MKNLISLSVSALMTFSSCGQHSYDHEKIEVIRNENSSVLMDARVLYQENWNELAQPMFWKKIMRLSPDSCIINVASNRQIIEITSYNSWRSKTEEEKQRFKDSIRMTYNLDSTEKIFVTTGKNDFYKFNEVYPSLSKGIEAFERFNVDPWYAQAILLIESPGQLKKSSVGAYGAFQLMPAVARSQGLTVNKYVDERKDFDRSAYAASRLIKNVCIPEAKRILNRHQLSFNETDLWFRLFVLHVYHAGANNVAAAVDKIAPKIGGKELITQLWQTTAASFGNNSQNYSQLALASQLILHEIVSQHSDHIHPCLVGDN